MVPWLEGLQWLAILVIGVMVAGVLYSVTDLQRRLGPDQGALVPNDGLDTGGRIHELGEGVNRVSKRSLAQASRSMSKWLKPSSLQRMPTPLKRCWMSHFTALSTKPLPSGMPSALKLG